MQIFIGDTAYQVDATASVESLKLMVENREFIPAGQFRLVNGCDVLEDGTLEANGVSEDDQLAMMLEIPAGMRKKVCSWPPGRGNLKYLQCQAHSPMILFIILTVAQEANAPPP